MPHVNEIEQLRHAVVDLTRAINQLSNTTDMQLSDIAQSLHQLDKRVKRIADFHINRTWTGDNP